jgi:hypothetical protein
MGQMGYEVWSPPCDFPNRQGRLSLGAFHEGMHQWDDEVAALLRKHAVARSVNLPQDLSTVNRG